MKIKKLETRQPWLCEVDGTTYVRTEIKWTDDRPNDVSWHLNEDQVEDKVYLTHEQLEKLFWESLFEQPKEIEKEQMYSEKEVLNFGNFCIGKVADFLEGKGDQTNGKKTFNGRII